MKLHFTKALVVTLFFASIAMTSWGQQRQFPNSPRGNALGALVAAIETADEAGVRAYVETHLSPALLSSKPASMWINRIGRIRAQVPEMGVRDLAPAGANGLSVTLYSRSLPNEVRVEMQLDPQNSALIADLKFTDRVVESSPLTLEGVQKELTDYLDNLATEQHFSGAFSLVHGEKSIVEAFYGSPDGSIGGIHNAETRFNVASMGKMFTSVAIAQLVEAGKLAFSDTVAEHYPEFPWSSYANTITVDQLLTHRSGLGNYDFGHGLTDVEQIVESARGEPIAFEPGSRMGYSNTGFAVLGVIIERVSGMNYYEYIQEHIFNRAGMTRSGFFSATNPTENMALGFTAMSPDGSTGSGQRQRNTSMIEFMGSPGGGAYSTIRDMIEFGRALVTNRLVSATMRDEMWTGRSEMGPGMEYAYGFGNSVRDGIHSIGHNGGAPGIGADFRIFPELDLIQIVFTNHDPDPIMAISSYVTRLLSRLQN